MVDHGIEQKQYDIVILYNIRLFECFMCKIAVLTSNVRLGFCRIFTEMESLILSVRIKRVS